MLVAVLAQGEGAAEAETAADAGQDAAGRILALGNVGLVGGGRVVAQALGLVVVVAGLATDYCVRATALDALALDYRVVVLTAAVRAVNLAPGDGARALAQLTAAGAQLQ